MNKNKKWENPHGIVANVLDYDVLVSEFELWDLKAFEGQGLRARLCCRKISDSIFWLHCFTPR